MKWFKTITSPIFWALSSTTKFLFCTKSLKIMKELGGLVLTFAPKLIAWAKVYAPYLVGGFAFVTNNQNLIYAVLAFIALYLALRD